MLVSELLPPTELGPFGEQPSSSLRQWLHIHPHDKERHLLWEPLHSSRWGIKRQPGAWACIQTLNNVGYIYSLMRPLHQPVYLGVIRHSSQLLHTKEFINLSNNMAHGIAPQSLCSLARDMKIEMYPWYKNLATVFVV